MGRRQICGKWLLSKFAKKKFLYAEILHCQFDYYKKLDFWLGFNKIFGTNKNSGKLADLVAFMLPDIISCEINLDRILSKESFS